MNEQVSMPKYERKQLFTLWEKKLKKLFKEISTIDNQMEEITWIQGWLHVIHEDRNIMRSKRKYQERKFHHQYSQASRASCAFAPEWFLLSTWILARFHTCTCSHKDLIFVHSIAIKKLFKRYFKLTICLDFFKNSRIAEFFIFEINAINVNRNL